MYHTKTCPNCTLNARTIGDGYDLFIQCNMVDRHHIKFASSLNKKKERKSVDTC